MSGHHALPTMSMNKLKTKEQHSTDSGEGFGSLHITKKIIFMMELS